MMSDRLFVFVVLACADGQIFFYVGIIFLEFGKEAFVGKIEWVRVGPVFLEGFVDAMDDLRIVDLNGEFATAVEAARGKIDGADNGTRIIGENQFGVQLDVLELVNLDANVLEGAQTADAFD